MVPIGFRVSFSCMIAVMEAVVVEEHEWSALQVHKAESPYKLMRRKSEAILMLSEGIGVDVVARLVERATRTVMEWARDWRRDRLSSICTGHVGNNNASKISQEQEKEILKALSRPPSEQGIAAEFWNIHDLAGWMHERFGIEYASESSYRSLLHMAGLSFHLPEEVDQRRADETQVEARMAKIHAKIAKIKGKKQDGQDEQEEDEGQRGSEKNECENEKTDDAEKGDEEKGDEDVIVVSADEVRIEHEAITRRAWCKKGARTRIRVDRKRQSQSYIGFLHEADGSVDLMRLDWQNTSNIVKALTDLTLKYPDKTIVVVWDNAGWHKSKKLREHLGKGNILERIHLINLPPYSPNKNPIERVWGEGKKSISNRQRAHFEDTRNAFETFIRSNKFPYRLTK